MAWRTARLWALLVCGLLPAWGAGCKWLESGDDAQFAVPDGSSDVVADAVADAGLGGLEAASETSVVATTASDGRVRTARLSVGYRGDLASAALDLLGAHGGVFGVEDAEGDLEFVNEAAISRVGDVVTFALSYRSVPVYGADVRVLGDGDSIRYVSATVPPPLGAFDTEPAVRADAARDGLAAGLEEDPVPEMGEPVLTIFDGEMIGGDGGSPELMWSIDTVTPELGPVRAMVSAATGELRVLLPLMPTALSRLVVGGQGNSDSSEMFDPESSLVFFDDDGAADVDDVTRESVAYADGEAAYAIAGEVYDWWFEELGVRSFDDMDSPIRVAVDWGFSSHNAAWFSNVDGLAFGAGMVARDVFAHEFGHAVLGRFGGPAPIYAGEPGAINESLADTFALLLDSDDWTIGEETEVGVIRDVSNPSARGRPACWSERRPAGGACEYVEYFCGRDHDFVHTNSSIGNHALYFMLAGSDGAPTPPDACLHLEDIPVDPVARDKVALFYATAVLVIGPHVSYRDLRAAVESACEISADRGFATDDDCVNVRNAFARVGIGEPDIGGELTVVARVDPRSPEVGVPALFTGQANDGTGPYTYRWDFGDGGVSTLPSDTHAYEAAGTYTVEFEVTDVLERAGSATLEVEVRDSEPLECDDTACPVGVRGGTFDDSGAPDCPPEFDLTPFGSGYGPVPLTTEELGNGCLGVERRCVYESSGEYLSIQLHYHPAANPERALHCEPTGCSGELGPGWETTGTDSFDRPVRFALWSQTTHSAVHVSFLRGFNFNEELRLWTLEEIGTWLPWVEPLAIACPDP